VTICEFSVARFGTVILTHTRDGLCDHLNAEIVAGTITTKQDAMDYVTWTYFFTRLIMNPRYVVGNGLSHKDYSSVV